MKILIAYDGSEAADSALAELKLSGLPHEGVEAHLVSVAEVWFPVSTSADDSQSGYPDVIERLTRQRKAVAEEKLTATIEVCHKALGKIRDLFPDWDVTDHVITGSPGWEILAYANEFAPDLIVVGATGTNFASRILLGSTTRKIITESKHSVRVVRKQDREEAGPLKILVGFDGSKGSVMAAERIASRNWHGECEVLLTAATHSFVPAIVENLIPPVKEYVGEDDEAQLDWLVGLAKEPMKKIEDAGHTVTFEMVAGNPKDVIIKTAIDWKADTIFLGAHSYSTLERIIIGSTAAAIAERAPCSVEICR